MDVLSANWTLNDVQAAAQTPCITWHHSRPKNPVDGDAYTDPNSLVFVYFNNKWNLMSVQGGSDIRLLHEDEYPDSEEEKMALVGDDNLYVRVGEDMYVIVEYMLKFDRKFYDKYRVLI